MEQGVRRAEQRGSPAKQSKQTLKQTNKQTNFLLSREHIAERRRYGWGITRVRTQGGVGGVAIRSDCRATKAESPAALI